MATYKRNKSGGSQSEGASNSASPASSVALSNPGSSQGINNNAPKYGTLVPNRIFVGGISSNTTEAELCQLFSKYGNVKATKIIADRAGVSKGYGFVTFESEEEVKFLIQDANNIVLKERRLNIAPAIKKQPFSRSFDASSPPPTTPNLYFHNGVPYTFHNGMAFFPPTPHQPALAALPHSVDHHHSMYPAYGPNQNTPSAPYGAPVLVPAPPPVFMPQNYSYQPLPMTNGAPTQFIYAGSASSNSSSGSPMAGTPDNPHLPSHLPPPFYAQQFAPQETYYAHPLYVSYPYNPGEYDQQDQQTTNDECSSTVSSPHSDISDRSSIRSPSNVRQRSPYSFVKNKLDHSEPTPERTYNKNQNTNNQLTESDSLVPVVSWQNLKNQAEEREMCIKDGRRAFHPIIPPPPQVMMYQQPSYPASYPDPGTIYTQHKMNRVAENARGHRQNFRGHSRGVLSQNNIPFIPKFPASFNNNNTLAVNNNFRDKKQGDVNGGRSYRYFNNRGRGGIRSGQGLSPPPPPPPPPTRPTNSFVSSPSPQVLQDRPYCPVDRPVMVANSAPRWPNPPSAPHQIKRLVSGKRQNGSAPNVGASSNSGIVRVTRKPQEQEDVDGDVGGGGDARPVLQPALTPPPENPEISSKLQSLSMGTSS